MDTLQTKMIDEIDAILNDGGDLFRAGYLQFESVNKLNGDKVFTFKATDPNNQFGTIDQDFIPSMFTGFIGSIVPTNQLYDENSTITIRFAVKADDTFAENYKKIEDFKMRVAGFKSEFTFNNIEYGYVLNGSPVTSPEAVIILNGVRVVYLDITVYYRLASGVIFGNDVGYDIRQNAIDIRDINDQPIITQEQKDALIIEVDTSPNLSQEDKDRITDDIANDIELSPEDKTLLINDRYERAFVILVRTGSKVAVGDILQSSQEINTREVTNISQNRTYGQPFTIYGQENAFYDTLKQITNDEEQINIVHVLRRTEKGVPKERLVIIENVVINDPLGLPVFIDFTLRKPKDILVTKELEDKGFI